jgi:hypothetical protein
MHHRPQGEIVGEEIKGDRGEKQHGANPEERRMMEPPSSASGSASHAGCSSAMSEEQGYAA